MRSDGPYFAALDYGTGGGKCAIFDAAGKRLAVAREAWTYQRIAYEHEQLMVGYGFDPHAFWSALGRCARQAMEESGIAASAVAGVAATAQRLGTVLLDARGREVYAAPNMDGRGLEGGFEVLEKLSLERAVRITGHWPPFVSSLARLLRFRKQPEQPKVAYVLTLNDWMTYRLCGALASEPSNAGESMLLDVGARGWSKEVLDLFEIDERLLPPVVEPGTPLGKLTDDAAAHTGLAAGTPVFAGGADTQCALLGAGVFEEGHAAAVLGTTTPVMLAVSSAQFDPEGKLWTGCHARAAGWTLESNAGETGTAFEWLLALLGMNGDDVYERAESLMQSRDGNLVTSFAGPHVFDLVNFDPNRPAGFLFRPPPLGERPGQGSFLHGFLAGIAYATRANLEQIEAMRGGPALSLTLTGGMTRLPTLLAEFARTTRVPLLLSDEPHATALGAALLASVGSRTHADVDSAVRAMVRTRSIEVAGAEAGEADYGRWRALYPEFLKLRT